MKALLLSGGIDSTAVAWWCRPLLAITIDYGQLTAGAEASAAYQVCKQLSIRHKIIRADCSSIGAGSMVGDKSAWEGVRQEWWPFRNQLIVTLAACASVQAGVTELLIGSVAGDEKFKDGTQEFVSTMDALLRCQEGAIRLTAPGIAFSSEELVKRSGIPGQILDLTFSCHVANAACGECAGCLKRLQVLSGSRAAGNDDLAVPPPSREFAL